jgi:protein N-lysine methyltransferase METTL21A
VGFLRATATLCSFVRVGHRQSFDNAKMSHESVDSDEEPFSPFGVSEDLVQSPIHKQASTNVVDFDGLLADHPLKLHEDLAEGNGGQAWPAGMVLAKYMLRRKRDVLENSTMCVAASSL